MTGPILDPIDVGARWYQDPNEVIYDLAYIYGQQKLGMDHAEANEYGKREVIYDKAVRRAVRDLGLTGPEAHYLAQDQAMEAEVSGAEPESASNRRMAATRLATPLASLPSDRPGQRLPIPTAETVEVYNQLLQQAEQQATNETPAAAPAMGEVPPEKHAVDALPQRTPSGRRLAGGYAVTGGLGLLGLLGLAALTDPYSVKPPRETQPV